MLKIATPEDTKRSKIIIEDAKKSIEYYLSLSKEEYDKLSPELRDSLANLITLYESSDLAMRSLMDSNVREIDVAEFASKYYRWLRGDSVPQEKLDRLGITEERYLQALQAEWCSTVTNPIAPVWVVYNKQRIYLLPPLHCREAVSIREQIGFVHDTPQGERYEVSSGYIQDNLKRIDLIQNPIQRQATLEMLLKTSVSVDGSKPTGMNDWTKAWADAIRYFDAAFGIKDNPVKKNDPIAEKKTSGYTGNLDDYF